jgi:hypothetical protein
MGQRGLYFTAIAILCVILTACSAESISKTIPTTESITTPLTQIDDISWEVDPSCGGYSFETETMKVVYVVNGGYQHISFYSGTNGHTIQVYLSPAETIILNTQQGITSCYAESYEGEGNAYTNPMIRILNRFAEQEFTSRGEVLLDGKSYIEHCAVQTVQKQTTPTTDYTLYTIQTNWSDGNNYLFQYQIFADGATLIVGNAPKELTERTTWCMDLEELQLVDHTSSVAIPVSVVAKSTGQGVSPWNDEKVTVEVQHFTYLYTDPQTGRIEKFQTVKDSPGALVTVLHTAQVTRPEITDNMTVMDDETLENALAIISMLEYLF